jgi:hypothetical protein
MAEELVAALTAAFLCAERDIEGKLREASLGADHLRSFRPHEQAGHRPAPDTAIRGSEPPPDPARFSCMKAPEWVAQDQPHA